MTDMDSSSPSATICTFQFCYHLLSKLSDKEIHAAFDGAKAKEVKSAGIIAAYKEIQIHGPVEFKYDIERVYIHRAEVAINPKCMDEIRQFCKTNDLEYEEFGEVPKPIPAVGGPVVGGIFGGGMIGSGFGGVGGVGYGFGSVGAPAYKEFSFGRLPIKPAKAIKYTAVSFPYSKPDEEKE